MANSSVVDLHREVSLGLLKTTPAYAVRTPRGQKDPGHLGWDPRANSPEESRRTIHALERNNDNLGIHLWGSVIDVDLDTDSPFMLEALDHFLPHTAHVWGRKSRPRTHRLYELAGMEAEFSPSDYPFLDEIKKHDALKVEVRGGKAQSGQYSLLPGSLHPSGEAYEWQDAKAARTSPVAVSLERVLNAIRFSCVVTLMAPYWTEGSRNSLCMAFSGFLFRCVAHAEEMGTMSGLDFRKDDAEAILRGLLKVAGDDENDTQMRLRTFEDTWAKGEKGAAIQGGATISKLTGDDGIVHLLYMLLVNSPDMVEFDKFLERYAVRMGTSNIIDRKRLGDRDSAFVMTVNDFRNSNMHMWVKSGTGGRMSMVQMLLASSRTLRVEGLAFEPGQPELYERGDSRFVNLWRGFAIEPYTGDVSAKDVQPFIDYMRVILASNNEKTFQWVMAWVADIFQNPGSKCGTALVIVGKPGAGKSFLGECIVRPIIGRNHSSQTNNVESLTGTFNADSANMLFVQADEAINTRRRADALRLKSMITDKTRRIEPKGVNAYEVSDYTRYYFTSNEENEAVAIVDGQDDRRYTVLKANSIYSTSSPAPAAEKEKFWDELHAWVEKKENLAKVHKFLLCHQYDRALIRKPLNTEARTKIQQHSQRGFDDWLMAIVSFEHPLENLIEKDQKTEESYRRTAKGLQPSLDGWPHYIAYRRLEDSYEYYRRRKGAAAGIPSYNAQQIRNEFRARNLLEKEEVMRVSHQYEIWNHGESQVVTKKIRISDMPRRRAIQDYLFNKYGFEVDSGALIDEEPIEMEKPEERIKF